MPTKGKAKGNRNESLVADKLSAWWGTPFKRIPNSGALRWNGVTFTYGDLLIPTDFPFIVECKHYKYVDLDELLRKDITQGSITKWWSQVTEDVGRCLAETGKQMRPMLIFKANNRPHRVCIDSLTFHQMSPANHYGVLTNLTIEYPLTSNRKSIVIADLSDFLTTYTKEDILAANLS